MTDDLIPGGQNLEAVSAEQIERSLTKIWEQALGLHPISRDANFFEIGGYSMLAVTLLNRVEQAFGRRLPMATLLSSASTIARMTEALAAPHVPGVSTIVEIHRGDRARPPVFWVPGGGGLSVLAFRQVSLQLGDDQPVYGFEARVELATAPTTTVEEIAAGYVAELRTFYPSGPYRLFGFSLGAITAFEMAVQLRRLGAEVDLLTLFDAALPLALSPGQKARAFAQRSVYHARTLLGGAPSEVVARCRQALQTGTTQLKRAVMMRTAARAPAPAATTEPVSVFDQLDRRNRLALQAYTQQAMPTFDGKVAMILASRTYRSALSADLDERLVWARLATQGIETHRVPGSHLSMLAAPDVDALAVTLRACIRAADQRRADTGKPTPAI